MYQLSTPSFRFVVFLIEEVRFKNSNGQGQQNQTQTTCYADTYEVNADGSITFYQIGINSGKRVKVPVLTYPHGKWTGIVLADDNNQFPVFNGNASFNVNSHVQSQFSPSSSHSNSNSSSYKQTDKISEDLNSDEETDKQFEHSSSQIAQTVEKSEDDLDSVMGMFDDGNSSSATQQPNIQNPANPHGNQQNHWGRTNPQPYNNPNTTAHIPNKGIPGISQNMNPNDFKKAKNEFLETQIKDYVKYNPIFNLEEMVTLANKEARSKNLGKFSETDIIWVASNLIREKSVQTRKFVEPVIQKNLSHMLPDIMRRQWSGKMGPILQVLEEREETKNVTAIDLAVWMVQNNFE